MGTHRGAVMIDAVLLGFRCHECGSRVTAATLRTRFGARGRMQALELLLP